MLTSRLHSGLCGRFWEMQKVERWRNGKTSQECLAHHIRKALTLVHHYQGKIDFNTTNTNVFPDTTLGMDYLWENGCTLRLYEVVHPLRPQDFPRSRGQSPRDITQASGNLSVVGDVQKNPLVIGDVQNNTPLLSAVYGYILAPVNIYMRFKVNSLGQNDFCYKISHRKCMKSK